MLIKNGLLFGTDGRFSVRDIAFGETIIALGELDGLEALDAAGKYVVPGFLDIHTHGAVGKDHIVAEALQQAQTSTPTGLWARTPPTAPLSGWRGSPAITPPRA